MSATPAPWLQQLPHWPAHAVDAAVGHCWQVSGRPACWAVACSAGADSVALLLACWRLLLQQGGPQRPMHVQVLHVHHGLQPAADDFSALVRRLGDELQALAPGAWLLLTVQVLRVQVDWQRGDSVEAAARQARYRALAACAREQGAHSVWLGHHDDDQAESVLLALTRGAGVAGLAGMGAGFERHAMRFARPLLDLDGQQLRAWLREHGVPWIDDPSNADLRFTRNRLRHGVLPALEQAVPAFRIGLARSARLAAQADALLQELADQDLQQVGRPPRIADLQRLSAARQANAIRRWLRQQHDVTGSEAQLQALLRQIDVCRTRGHRIRLRLADGMICRLDDRLHWQPGTKAVQ